MDDLAPFFAPVCDEPDDGQLDHWLRSLFQTMLAEPVPPRFIDLVERLDASVGI